MYMGVNGEALQLHAVHKKPHFYYKSHKNLYQVLQVTLKPVSVLQVMWKPISVLQVQAIAVPDKISLVCYRWHFYSCCILITIQTAKKSWSSRYSFLLSDTYNNYYADPFSCSLRCNVITLPTKHNMYLLHCHVLQPLQVILQVHLEDPVIPFVLALALAFHQFY